MGSALIMPCAGKSTRFHQSKPKWMLTSPNGDLMVMSSMFGVHDLQDIERIIITVVKEHVQKNKINLDVLNGNIRAKIGRDVEILVLDDFTSSQSETVYETISRAKVTTPFFIKDCDNYFNTTVPNNNCVCISKLGEGITAINKSYISLNKYGYVSGIIEKRVIGEMFCCGGYSFSDPEQFVSTFNKLNSIKGASEIYISHIIQQMILEDVKFEVQEVQNYIDWGTNQEWNKYLSRFKVLFVDIDGCLVENSGEYFTPQWGETNGLPKNVAHINSMFDSGNVTVILTTSRKQAFRDVTETQLKSVGLKYHNIIFDLPHCQRVIINDFAGTNPYPSAVAINIPRNSDTLENYKIF